MDELDKIILRALPNTGLCPRSCIKQEKRRKSLRSDILRFIANEELIVDYSKCGVSYITKEGSYLAIDEMQFNEQDKIK